MSINEPTIHNDENGGAAIHTLARMQTGDLPHVLAIERCAFSDPWPEMAFVQAVSCATCHARVARFEGMVVGYLIAYANGPEIHIANVAVSPHFRRRGIGRDLLVEVLTTPAIRCRYAILDVRESNSGAIALYEDLGFRQIGRRMKYYRYPVEDALVMRAERRPEN